jgi:ribosome-binding protein aMBF1 (putative translation factor)
MNKSFSEYAAKRAANASVDEVIAVEVFDRALALGGILADARKARGLKQIELAVRCGVTQADISRIERGLMAPTTTTLMRITEALNAQVKIELLPV